MSLVEGAYLKRTKWENAGLIYDTETEQILPATVSEYLFRLAWQDVFFGTMTLILGIVEERQYRYAILTWQKEVVGRTPTEEEIEKAMIEAGFTFVISPVDDESKQFCRW